MKIEVTQSVRCVLPALDPRGADGQLVNVAPMWTDRDCEADFDLNARPYRELRLEKGTRIEIDEADFNWFRERLPKFMVLIDCEDLDRIGGAFPGISTKQH